MEGTKHQELLDYRICDFLNIAHNGRPDNTAPLSRAIAKLEDVLKVSQISVSGIRGKQENYVVFKKYDTRILNTPDWEYSEEPDATREIRVSYWKDGNVIWDEADINNMVGLSHFIILYMSGLHYVNDAVSASVHDTNSGLVNLTGFTNAVQNLIRAKLSHCYSIVYISSPKFLAINRKYGYEIGNRVMLQTFKRLKQFTQQQQSEQVIARLVNDNLVVIVHNKNVEAYIDYLQKMELSFMFMHERITQKLECRIGVYQMKRSEISPQQPLEYAMTANSFAQQSSVKRVMYYTEEIHNRFLREKEIEARMSEAVEKHEFEVFYQPKINLRNNKLVGAEALVRWNMDGKIITPDEFIPIFERNGFVCQLDFYVLETVCKHMRKWLDVGVEVVKTSVNFSRVHLSDLSFTKRIINVLRNYRIPAKYIEIEFTETGDSDVSNMLALALEELKNYGIATAMDDFGSGYSSLSLLTNMSFDILKIDKSFLEAGTISDRERVVINNIIRMVQDLNIDVIMEGVETLEQVKFLKEIHCNMAQGFIFDRPLPISIFEERLKSKLYRIEESA